MKPLCDGSAIYIKGLLWLCRHGVGYPDICNQCSNAKKFGTVANRLGFMRSIENALRQGIPPSGDALRIR